MSSESRPTARSSDLGSPIPSLLLCAITLGVWLRIDGLERKSLWLDEVLTYRRMALPSLSRLLDNLGRSPFPPLYYVALWGWVRVWGLSDLTLRALPAALGVLALPATYFTWRRPLGSEASLLATALLAMNSYHVWYSQDAKMYAAVWLLAMVSSGAFLNLLLYRDRSRAWWVLYGTSTSCLLLVSYVGVCVPAVQAIFGVALAAHRGRLWRQVPRLATAGLALAVPLAIWLPSHLRSGLTRRPIEWIPQTDPSAAFWDFYQLLGEFLIGYTTPLGRAPGSWGWVLGPPYAVCVLGAALLLLNDFFGPRGSHRASPVGGAQLSLHERPRPEACAYLALWFALPVVGDLMFSLAFFPLWGVPRYLCGCAPALTLWLASALLRSPRRRVALALGSLIVALNLASIVFDRTHPTRAPWTSAARVLILLSDANSALGDGPAPTDSPGTAATGAVRLNVVCLGGPQEILVLEHARGALALTKTNSVIYTNIDFSVNKRQPFAIVHCRAGTPDGGTLPPPLDAWANVLSARRVFTGRFHEERLTATPSPFEDRQLDVWLCVPRAQPAVGSGGTRGASGDEPPDRRGGTGDPG